MLIGLTVTKKSWWLLKRKFIVSKIVLFIQKCVPRIIHFIFYNFTWISLVLASAETKWWKFTAAIINPILIPFHFSIWNIFQVQWKNVKKFWFFRSDSYPIRIIREAWWSCWYRVGYLKIFQAIKILDDSTDLILLSSYKNLNLKKKKTWI